jgi:glycosyltransferase involved in cell wall biosynthesis
MKEQWSVVIRTQGKRNKTLRRAINSVKKQSYESKDIIIAYQADLSEEKDRYTGVENIVSRESCIDIRLVKADPNKGRGHVINVGLDACQAEYVSILDDDDVYLPSMGEDLISVLDQRNKNLAYGNTIVVRHKDTLSDSNILGARKEYGEEFNPVRLVAENYIHLSGVIYRFSDFTKCRINEEIDMWEDWYLLLKLLFTNRLKAVYIDKEVSEYHVLGKYVSNTFHKKALSEIKKNYKTIEKDFEGENFPLFYRDVFTIYPKLSVLKEEPNKSDIQQLLNQVERFNHIKSRKSYQFFSKLFKW